MYDQKAFSSAIRMLGAREHSERELRNKLQRRYPGQTQEQLDELIAELNTHNLLSDLRFTESLIRSRVDKGYGPFFIQQELASKGIAKHLIESQLESADINWLERAADLIERKFPCATSDEVLWAKAIRFMQRRGFSGQTISAVLGGRPRLDAGE
ncbi:MAG: regulatory protein RecX [bacterium]